MAVNKYIHNLPLNIPVFFIILGIVHLPNSVFVASVHSDATLWNIVTTSRNHFVPELMVIWNYASLGVDLVFIFIGVWLLLNKERAKQQP